MAQINHKLPHKYKLKNRSVSGRPVHNRTDKDKKLSLVYACVKDCTHYVTLDFAEGKKTECFGCGKEMPITVYEITRKIVQPMCRECRNFREMMRKKVV